MAEKLTYTGKLRAVGDVDFENRTIRGYVVAQEGPFKSGRGEFDSLALDRLVELGNAAENGVLSRVTHPEDDATAFILGRARNFERRRIMTSDGEEREATIADLTFNKSASLNPNGDWPAYLMALVEEDASAISTSIVLETEMEFRTDEKGRQLRDENGDILPPLWRPTVLHATDIVDIGDAVDGILPKAYLSQNQQLDAATLLAGVEGELERLRGKVAVLEAKMSHLSQCALTDSKPAE